MASPDLRVDIDPAERTLITPEGVDLRLKIASAGQRAGAFLMDGLIILLALILLVVLVFAGAAAYTAATGLGAQNITGELIGILLVAGLFFIRNGYFIGFELSPRAATPGKRLAGIRVAARNGGRLRAEAIFARNMTREFELFMPFGLVLMAMFIRSSSVEGAYIWLTLLWCSVFIFFPLFNRDRLRAGDLIGGTWVVRVPKQALVRDMADDAEGRLQRFGFTTAQLDAYGVKELHVLEDVLRLRDRKTMQAVADRIAGKIGWRRTEDDDFDFLGAYYAGLRGRLEARLLMGKRRKDKFDTNA